MPTQAAGANGCDSREHQGMSRLTAIATGIGVTLLPVLFLILPHLNRSSVQGTPSLSGALQPATSYPAAALRAVPQPAPPRALHPIVTSVEQGVQVCAGTRREDWSGQPVEPPVEAVIMADPNLSDAWNPPPLVDCQYL